MMFALCVMMLFPQMSNAAENYGPLRPETPVRGLHANSWKGRYAVIEAEVKHLAKLYKDRFNNLISSQRECLRAKIAVAQSDVHLAWAKGSGLEASERMLNEDLRETMKKTCGGGGGGNPAIELYNDYIEEYGQKAMGDLIDYMEEHPEAVQVITNGPVAEYKPVKNPRWEVIKAVAMITIATSQTAFTYRVLVADIKRFLATGKSQNPAMLVGAGLMFVAATGGTGLVLIF